MTNWFHISQTWIENPITISPRIIRVDDSENHKDTIPAIAVAPSIAQCLVALGDWQAYARLRVYCTSGSPIAAKWVFDFKITQEHRFYEKKTFKFVREYIPKYFLSRGVPNIVLCGEKEEVILKRAKHVLPLMNKALQERTSDNERRNQF